MTLECHIQNENEKYAIISKIGGFSGLLVLNIMNLCHLLKDSVLEKANRNN